jgi:hypothetical protein
VKRERQSRGEILGWSVVGFGAGVLCGLWAAGWLGRGRRGRLADGFRTVRTRGGASAVALAESIRHALAADPALAPFELDALAVSGGTVELTGWVPDRPARARAVRVASRIRGLEALINSILVHGEDDLSPPGLSLAGRSA